MATEIVDVTEILENKNVPPAVIEQINIAYDADQDRLLLKVGLSDNTELSIWLTRRIVKSIWTWLYGSQSKAEPALQVFMMNAQGGLDAVPPKLMTMKEISVDSLAESATASLEFKTPYQAQRVPIINEALLAVACEIVEDSATQFVLDLSARDQKRARVAFSLELKMAFFNMLQLAIKEAGWDIHLQGRHILHADATSQHVFH